MRTATIEHAEPEFATIRVAARRVGVGEKQLRRACASGDLPLYRVGGWPRVRLEEVRGFIRAQRVPVTRHAEDRVAELLAREER